MDKLPNCPVCEENFTYEDRGQFICPMCGHEWSINEIELENIIVDAHGNQLKDGDTVSVIKDLKVKNSSLVIKQGTKVKNYSIDRWRSRYRLQNRWYRCNAIKV